MNPLLGQAPSPTTNVCSLLQLSSLACFLEHSAIHAQEPFSLEQRHSMSVFHAFPVNMGSQARNSAHLGQMGRLSAGSFIHSHIQPVLSEPGHFVGLPQCLRQGPQEVWLSLDQRQ